MRKISVETELRKGLEALQLSLAIKPFLDYLLLLEKWNRTYNLTAIETQDAMITSHILDSLAIIPWIQGASVLDVGSGAGLPGIPLALAHPDWIVTLLDSNGKKIQFLQEAKRILALENVCVVQSRVESYHPVRGFDTVVSRAFSGIPQMIHLTEHLVLFEGRWVAMKGKVPYQELQECSYPCKVQSYTVPGLNAERCCILISKES